MHSLNFCLLALAPERSMEMEDKIRGKSNGDGPIFMVDFSVKVRIHL